jgi:biopolymer transport protein ExbD
MRSRIQFDNQDADSDIDMTPMLDIVFIMLIFFIVSTTFVKEAGVEINRPSAATAESQESTGVMVAINAAGEIWLENKQTDLRMIRPKLERLLVEQPDMGVMVQADEEAKTGILIKVMDQIKLAGISQVAVSSEKLSSN